MTISIINGPSIDVNTRSSSGAAHFYNEIREIWSGYRTCGCSVVDWEDARPFPLSELSKSLHESDDDNRWLADETANKNWHVLCDAFVTDAVECFRLQRNIAMTYHYKLNSRYFTPDDNLATMDDFVIINRATEFVNSIVDAVLKRRQSDDPEGDYIGALEWFRVINACKTIADKLKIGDESAFGHGIITYTLHNISQSLIPQLIRNCTAYSIQETPYDPNNLSVVLPIDMKNNSEATKAVMTYFEQLPGLITILKNRGIKNVRYAYPGAMPTDIKITMTFSELRKFFKMRINKDAQDEIRLIAFDLWTAMCNCMPFIWTYGFTYLTFEE